jgi:hypothetical protein
MLRAVVRFFFKNAGYFKKPGFQRCRGGIKII